jgi:hypothetical protein
MGYSKAKKSQEKKRKIITIPTMIANTLTSAQNESHAKSYSPKTPKMDLYSITTYAPTI